MTQEEPNLGNWLHALKTATKDDISTRRERGMEQVRGYVQYASDNDFVLADIDEWTLAIEMPFEVEIGNTLIKGAIDQVILHPDGYEVRDLKTGNRQTSALQLGVYKVALEKIFGWPVILGSYYYAKDNKVLTIPKQEMDRWTEEYLTQLFDELERGIENKVFLPNPGGHCMLCPVKKHCREMGDVTHE
jgi:CRISPR/Cas system-associated exonuclease Cas4 (RecB family)